MRDGCAHQMLLQAARVSGGRVRNLVVLPIVETADARSHRGDPPVFPAVSPPVGVPLLVPQSGERATLIAQSLLAVGQFSRVGCWP